MLKRVGLSVLMAALRPSLTIAAKLTAGPILPPNLVPASQIVPADATASRLKPLLGKPELPLLDVDFCGECMPFHQTEVVSRWKHVFTLFRPQARSLDALRERADAFFPIIEPIMAKYDIPDDFRYVPMAESDLQPRAVSHAGAAGYWQLMPGTARALGLKVGKGVDERFNAKKATEAACKYLRDLYTQLGSWSLVAAAYNAGPGHLKNQLRRNSQADYYSMTLPRETRYYLFRVLVYKEVMSRPNDYLSFLTPLPQTA
ncbi:lytic transglycosylase domain-containing protein [Spirosoma rhododendri]